jgi:hypothetical protein
MTSQRKLKKLLNEWWEEGCSPPKLHAILAGLIDAMPAKVLAKPCKQCGTKIGSDYQRTCRYVNCPVRVKDI